MRSTASKPKSIRLLSCLPKRQNPIATGLECRPWLKPVTMQRFSRPGQSGPLCFLMRQVCSSQCFQRVHPRNIVTAAEGLDLMKKLEARWRCSFATHWLHNSIRHVLRSTQIETTQISAKWCTRRSCTQCSIDVDLVVAAT